MLTDIFGNFLKLPIERLFHLFRNRWLILLCSVLALTPGDGTDGTDGPIPPYRLFPNMRR